jgi:signal transduction histidine kinase
LLRGERETLQRELPSSITLELALDEAAPEIRADPGQLVRAVVELLHNARDAMPEGGTATLRTEASADSATVHVCDTGRGVPAEARPRLFEPFFTTKPRGVGKGLGLAFVYGVVSQAGGEVGVYSKPGRGAVFSMRFPRAAG